MSKESKIEAVVHALNPCNAPEESIRWRLACLFFPECWCCAGFRGIIYGMIIMGLISYAGGWYGN